MKEPFCDVRIFKSIEGMLKGVKEMEGFGYERYFYDETYTTGFYLMTHPRKGFTHQEREWLLLRVIEDGRAYEKGARHDCQDFLG